MPDEITTGFAAYCAAVAAAFGSIIGLIEDDDDVDSFDEALDQLILEDRGLGEDAAAKRRRFKDLTPEIRCGIDIYKRDRFYTNSTMRLRTWNLKGGVRGARNRPAIFQDIWLGADALIMVRSVRAASRDIEAQMNTIGILKKFRKEQNSSIIGFLFNRSADEGHCTAIIRDLKRNVEETSDSLQDMIAKSGDAYTEYHIDKLHEYVRYLSGLIRAYDMIGNDTASYRRVQNGLRQIDRGYLDVFEQRLNEWRRLLSKAKSPLSEWLDDGANRANWCEESVSNCVKEMIAGGHSVLWIALTSLGSERFAQVFCEQVVPALEAGFSSEAYDEESIHAFRVRIREAANKLTDATETDSEAQYRDFMKLLVKSLIYGPSPESKGKEVGTDWDAVFVPLADESLEEFISQEIVVSQLLTADGSLLGGSRTFGPNDVIFFGRCYAVDAFIDRVREDRELFSPRFAANLLGGSKCLKVYPIGEAHGQVSNLHGMMAHSDGVWKYWDFSRYGTRILGRGEDGMEQDVSLCRKVRKVKPGNVLYLGAKVGDEKERLFYRAAAIKVSFCLDTDIIVDVDT